MNPLGFVPLALVVALLIARRAGKPLSWPMILAPLALYALPVLIALGLIGGVLYAILRRIPGGKFAMGSVAALLAGGVVWLRKLMQALRA